MAIDDFGCSKNNNRDDDNTYKHDASNIQKRTEVKISILLGHLLRALRPTTETWDRSAAASSPAAPGNPKIEVRFCKNGCPGARGLATQTRTRRDGARTKTAAAAPMLCSKTSAILNKKRKPVSGATVQTRTRRDGRSARPATNPYQARRSAKKSNAGFSEFSDDF